MLTIPAGTPSVTLSNTSHMIRDIVCNNFSIKETILGVLKKYQADGFMDHCDIDEVAEEITEEFAIKLRLKQGK